MTTGKTIALSGAVLVAAIGALVAGWYVSANIAATPMTSTDSDASSSDRRVGDVAFFYQNVGNMQDGRGENATRVGFTEDGIRVSGAGQDVLAFTALGGGTDSPGDPTFSHLAHGNWAVTAWTNPDHPMGVGQLMYYESSCPMASPSDFHIISPSSDPGCFHSQSLTGGKTSQIVADGEDEYVTQNIAGEIYLTHLADATHSAMDLETLCVLQDGIAVLSDLDYGSSVKILSRDDAGGILLSDTAFARRTDGTWVLFVKGIASDTGCTPNTLCELCQRGIYRTTSDDLIHWSALERVVDEASVPDAYTGADGNVWLYWQDFSDVCAEQDQHIAVRAPLAAAYETDGDFSLSSPERVVFMDEPFEEDESLHYATNANPILLNTSDADALEACF